MTERTTAGPRPAEPAAAAEDTTVRPFRVDVPDEAPKEVAMTAAEPSAPAGEMTITEHELAQCERANQTGRLPVVFVHGRWLLPASWDRWAELFEANGYVALTPGWPDHPDTVTKAKAHPGVFADKTVGQVVVDPDPGRSRAGRGVGAIDPAPSAGSCPCPPPRSTGHRQRLARDRRHRPGLRHTLHLVRA
jgi:hypothetical protein